MALTYIGIDKTPTYTAVSTDISSNKITGIGIVGATVFITDNATWKIVLPDLTLAAYKLPPVV